MISQYDITFLFFDIVDIGNLLIAALSFFPMILNFKYYKKTGILDYLLVSIYFFNWSIICSFHFIYIGFSIPYFEWDGIVGDFGIVDLIYGKIIFYYMAVLDAFPLFVVAIRAKYGDSFKNIPNLIKGLGILSILAFFLTIIDQGQMVFNPNVVGVTFFDLVLVLNRCFFHLFVVYAFISSSFQKTSRAKVSRKIWIIASAIWAFSIGLSGFWGFILEWNFTDPLLFALFIIPIDIGFALLLINHVLYPESVLFTHEQVIRALKAYPLVEEANEKNPSWGITHIKEYLDSIPEDIKKQMLKTNVK